MEKISEKLAKKSTESDDSASDQNVVQLEIRDKMIFKVVKTDTLTVDSSTTTV